MRAERAECLKAGANDYVRKPVNEETFLKEIKNLLTSKKERTSGPR
jgi:DNA-binding response OmpR family regulator